MIRDLCEQFCLNKNLLMLLAVGIYILALFAVLSGTVIIFASIFTLVMLIVLLKNIFPAKYILILTLLFYLGIINTSTRLKNSDELLSIAPVNAVIKGKIVSIPQIKDDNKVKFFFRVNEIEYDGITKDVDNEKVFVTLNVNEKLKPYDYYKISGRLSVPFKAGNPSQFDYSNYLRNYATYSVFYAKSFEKLDKNREGLECFLQSVNNYREKIISMHAKNLKSPNLEILGGIVFGDDAISPPDNIKKSFVNSGLLHILAASGMNVAFIFSFFFCFLSMLRVNYKLNISFCIFMVIIYVLMTGLGPSVIRAACMLIFVLIGKLIDRDVHSIALLAFVALLMLLYNPLYINDVGFQLSFVVTFGLLLMTPYLIRSKNRFVNWIIGTISVPIIAQLWVVPIQIFYFNSISLYSVLANIMSVPILSIISFVGFISSLLAPITPGIIFRSFDFALNPMISVLVNISDFWGNLPMAALHTVHPNIFQVILYYLLLMNITALAIKTGVKQRKFLQFALAGFIIILVMTFVPIKNSNLEIIVFDVGNADSFLIKSPDNKYIMIDTAKNGYNGGKSQAEFLILKYMLDRGIKNIDTIIVTHFDNDHCGGAVDIIKGVKVDNLYVNNLNHNSNAAKNIYATAKKYDVKLVLAQNGQIVFNRDGLKVTNFVSAAINENDDNEASVITGLEYGSFKMLFTGDSGILAFKNLKPLLPQNITVLKVGHHGALGVVNKSMIDYLNPKFTLISVGENRFGHPAEYTLKTLKNTKILRTDIDNSIKFVISKNGYKIFTYDTSRKRYLRKYRVEY